VEVIGLLLDTSAYSALMRGHSGVKRALGHADETYVNPVVLGELRAGFLKGARTARNEAVLREFLAEPRVHSVPIDEDTTERYAVIYDALQRRGTPVSVNDVWIAASAFQHGLRVLTTDGDFRKIPQILVEYLEPADSQTLQQRPEREHDETR